MPEDVKAVIKGPKFAVNIYSYAPVHNIGFYSSLFADFEFALTNPLLDDFDIKSDGSVFNAYPMLTCVALLMSVHLCLYVAHS